MIVRIYKRVDFDSAFLLKLSQKQPTISPWAGLHMSQTPDMNQDVSAYSDWLHPRGITLGQACVTDARHESEYFRLSLLCLVASCW